MLSDREKAMLFQAKQDMSQELQIILLWIVRLTDRNPQDALMQLRESLYDWQENEAEPE